MVINSMTTIAFLSLFFGLIRGPHPVELAVDGPVAAVELLVDGKSVQTLQAPWKTEVDFGPDLQPHEIVARALDPAGHEIGRAQEWANLPHPLARVDVMLEGDPPGPPKAVRVIWTDVKGEKPVSAVVIFDGRSLPLDASGRVPLPPHDLTSLHVLSAEIEFSGSRKVRKEVAYGGEYGSAVSTELTGVPVHVRPGTALTPGKLAGWLTAAGQPLPVDAVEEGPGQLYVVRSADLSEAWKVGSKGHLFRHPNLRLAEGDQVRFMFPYSQRFESSGEMTDLFEVSPMLDTGKMGLSDLVLRVVRAPIGGGKRRRIADAVAVAGLEAMTENRRRAILLVLSGYERDQGRLDPATVRRFLAAIHVPLFVWTLDKPAPESTAAAWGRAEDVSEARNLLTAVEEIRQELASQRIVMVDGRLLPQSIRLSPAASGLELAGGAP
jgi:hypothetical protein